MINYVVAEAGAFGFRYFIEDRAQGCARRFRIHTFESIARESSLPSGTWVIATDQLLPAERLVMAEICDQLIGRGGPAVRVLNHPAHVLNRVTLLDTLHRSGRSRFRAVRASESFEQLRYPVFVREAVDHTGSLTPLLRDPHEVRQALLRLTLRGLSRRDLLVVEFCDTADPNGVFRKYSAYVVGARVLRHGRPERGVPQVLGLRGGRSRHPALHRLRQSLDAEVQSQRLHAGAAGRRVGVRPVESA